AVYSQHKVWGNLWTSDRLFKFDPAASKWTMFELPVHGTEIRHISLLERDGKLQVIVPVYRSSQMGVMTLRSEGELAALKAQARYSIFPSSRLCTKNTSWALIERPYSCAPQAVGTVYDRPGFFVQSPMKHLATAFILAATFSMAADAKDSPLAPLSIARQGYFFVGGKYSTVK